MNLENGKGSGRAIQVPVGVERKAVEEFVKFLYLEQLDKDVGIKEEPQLLRLAVLKELKLKREYQENLVELIDSFKIIDGQDAKRNIDNNGSDSQCQSGYQDIPEQEEGNMGEFADEGCGGLQNDRNDNNDDDNVAAVRVIKRERRQSPVPSPVFASTLRLTRGFKNEGKHRRNSRGHTQLSTLPHAHEEKGSQGISTTVAPFVLTQLRERPPKKDLGARPSKSQARMEWDSAKIKERDELAKLYPEIPFKGDVKEIRRRHRDPSNPLRLPQHEIPEPPRKPGKKKKTLHGGKGMVDDPEIPYWWRAYTLAQEKEGILQRHGRGKAVTYHFPRVYTEQDMNTSLSDSSDDFEVERRSHKKGKS